MPSLTGYSRIHLESPTNEVTLIVRYFCYSSVIVVVAWAYRLVNATTVLGQSFVKDMARCRQ